MPEWEIGGETLCRSGESGLGNSSAYDAAVLLDAPDFAAHLCSDFRCLALLAAAVDNDALAAESQGFADEVAAAANRVLWCEAEGCYKHRAFDGAFVRPKTVAGLLPLAAFSSTMTRWESCPRAVWIASSA